MKKTILTLTLILTSLLSFSQVSLKVKSGDAELDLSLGEINTNAEKDYSLFKTEMKTSYSVTIAKIDELKLTFSMQASDIFMTLEIAKSTGKTVDVVAAEFKKSKGKGWGVIAKNLGIKPGSDEFHALKGNASKKGKSKANKTSKDKSTNGKETKTKTKTKGK